MKQNILECYAKNLRRKATTAESKLWFYLRNRRFCNYKFRRQYWIRGYIVDFVCLEAKLIVELDGALHMEQMNYDHIRTSKLQQIGFHVIRFWNNQIFNEMEKVLEVIYDSLIHPHPPAGTFFPSKQRTFARQREKDPET